MLPENKMSQLLMNLKSFVSTMPLSADVFEKSRRQTTESPLPVRLLLSGIFKSSWGKILFTGRMANSKISFYTKFFTQMPIFYGSPFEHKKVRKEPLSNLRLFL